MYDITHGLSRPYPEFLRGKLHLIRHSLHPQRPSLRRVFAFPLLGKLDQPFGRLRQLRPLQFLADGVVQVNGGRPGLEFPEGDLDAVESLRQIDLGLLFTRPHRVGRKDLHPVYRHVQKAVPDAHNRRLRFFE